MKNLYYLFILILFSGCSENDNLHQQNHLGKTGINIYLVKDDEPQFATDQLNSAELQLEETPWLKYDEIGFYDWSSHIFYLKNEKSKSNLEGRNFVLKAGDKPLFAGIFFPAWMSSIPQIPSIIAHDGNLPDDVVAFGQYGYIHSGNMDNQTGFKQALVSAGLFLRGIEVDVVSLKKCSSSSLEYTFKVTNRDVMSIYVPDPGKMGDKRFHFFTNGVFLQDEQTIYYPNNENTATEKIESGWYYKLRPGESMTRTARAGGFQHLPSGTVTCYFAFPGAKVETGEWKKHNGRIWLGNIRVEKEMNLK